MESLYLKGLSEECKKYKRVLIYGAGGVAEGLLILLEAYFNKDRLDVVVTDKKRAKPSLGGFSVKEISEYRGMCNEVYVIVAVMPCQALEIEKNLNMLGFSNYSDVSELINQVYQEIWKAPIEKRRIVFANGSGWGFGGNPKYIALDLLKTQKELDLVWVTRNPAVTELPEGIRPVAYGTYEHYYALGTSEVWIDNQHKNFFTRKREGQFYVQTWHGGGPLKKIEFDAEGLPGAYLDLCEMNSEMEDLMVSPTKFNSVLYRRAFHYKGEILECGYPRNDIFWKPDLYRKKVEGLYGISAEEGIVLYAPTFRERDTAGVEKLDLRLMRQALARRFGKNYRVLVRCHPSDKESAKKYQLEGSNASDYDDSQELLVAADILVTDYSSIMWDFSLQKKPVFLFHPDLQMYEKERGYYLAFDEMPYIEAFGNEDLCEKIAGFDETGYQQEMADFLEKYGSLDEGNAAIAVTEKIVQVIGQG